MKASEALEITKQQVSDLRPFLRIIKSKATKGLTSVSFSESYIQNIAGIQIPTPKEVYELRELGYRVQDIFDRNERVVMVDWSDENIPDLIISSLDESAVTGAFVEALKDHPEVSGK